MTDGNDADFKIKALERPSFQEYESPKSWEIHKQACKQCCKLDLKQAWEMLMEGG